MKSYGLAYAGHAPEGPVSSNGGGLFWWQCGAVLQAPPKAGNDAPKERGDREAGTPARCSGLAPLALRPAPPATCSTSPIGAAVHTWVDG